MNKRSPEGKEVLVHMNLYKKTECKAFFDGLNEYVACIARTLYIQEKMLYKHYFNMPVLCVCVFIRIFFLKKIFLPKSLFYTFTDKYAKFRFCIYKYWNMYVRIFRVFCYVNDVWIKKEIISILNFNTTFFFLL